MEDKKMIRNLVLTTIISADNEEFTEDVKQAIITRMKEKNAISIADWDPETLNYVLEPIEDEKVRNGLVELLG